MKSIGQQAKEFREWKGWNYTQMAAAVTAAHGSPVSRQVITQLEEKGDRRPHYLTALARVMGMAPEELERGQYSAPGAIGEGQSQVTIGDTSVHTASAASTMQPILSWEHPDDLPAGEFVLIPRLNVVLSAGGGRDQVEIQFIEKQPQAFRADWIRKKHLKPAKLASMVADGDSMEERIQHGDALVVDTSQRDVVDGKVYALWYDGGERVKRLFRLPGGGLRIKSDNDGHPTIELQGDSIEHVRIIGRVVHVAGEGGL